MRFLELITASGPETAAARGWAALWGDRGSGWEGRAASGTLAAPDAGLRILQTREGKTTEAGRTEHLRKVLRQQRSRFTSVELHYVSGLCPDLPPRGLFGVQGTSVQLVGWRARATLATSRGHLALRPLSWKKYPYCLENSK